jgi:hypothetical protein
MREHFDNENLPFEGPTKSASCDCSLEHPEDSGYLPSHSSK